ncbi:PREDICTED: uncharacterized protein LOC109127309 [Camelina sativa]|uniref:Uncharacterized protein LOC109127309 n=1 Tax=Camelina sativa TaxID=90675 RepID=A0ABM1QL10_CAMSA|nr:PREDICTED: uncharacterized protein LOC109127309 [Camelina sativa]
MKTDILALFETHASGNRAGQICQGLGFENSFRVDVVGYSRGIWLLWRSGIGDMEIVESTDQFVVAKLRTGMEIVNMIVVYAAPTVIRRSGIWDKLAAVVQGLVGPLFNGGDFNTIVRLDERSGDMGFRGNKFTWRRGRVEDTFVTKRLDRVLCCPHARLKWQEARVTHLPFLASDHAPLYVQMCPVVGRDPDRRPFRFVAAWLTHPSFKELLVASWNVSLTTPEALNELSVKLKQWNRDVFGAIQKRKDGIVRELQIVQDALDLAPSDDMLSQEEVLLKQFEEVLEQKEILWFQKSREKWVALGDHNTKYFHTSTVIRRRHNRVEMLRNDEDQWTYDATKLENLAVQYYKSLIREDRECLNRTFTAIEVEEAVRSMGKFKAPGPDGYQPVFYQECWEVVRESVVRFVLDFFNSGTLPPETNDALVVLIPQVATPERIVQFCPISLCNVLFKTITKMMVLRLNRVIGGLIGPGQSSFIPGRLSIDNIVVVQDAVHSMRRKKGRKGWMLLKLHLEKAYNRIR